MTWKPNRQLTLYGAFKTGYKSGGFSNSANVSVRGSGAKDLAFEPETVKGGEAGMKTTLLDDRLRLDATVYHYTFADLQVDFYDSEHLTLVTTNAGSATTSGAEVAFQFLPPNIEGLRIAASMQFMRYRVQISRDPEFGAPLLDQTLDAPTLSTRRLHLGMYYARVQTIAADGSTAPFGTPEKFEIPAPLWLNLLLPALTVLAVVI